MLGILGFMMSLLAMFFASEVMRRANQRQTELETALMKAQAKILTIESKMGHVDRLAAEIRYQKKRQAETMTALANKTAVKSDGHGTTPKPVAKDRFTPSEYKGKKVG